MHTDKFLMELQASLAARAENVCRRLLPGGKRIKNVWQCGGVDGGPGKSMEVELEGDKAGVWHDRATGESGRLLKLWQENQGISFDAAVNEACAFCNLDAFDDSPPSTEDRPISFKDYRFDPPPPPKLTRKKADDGPPPMGTDFDWQGCLNAMTEGHIKKLADWRGFSIEFCRYLHQTGMIGVFRGNFALPVHNTKGEVVRCHYRMEKGWAYFPGKGESTPLVTGSPEHAVHTIVGESQWDVFAILDRIGHHEDPTATAGVITRGANCNTNLSGLPVNKIIVVPQNDPADKASKSTGRTPAQEWMHQIQRQRGEFIEFTVSTIPSEYKDANDWIRAENPTKEDVWKRIITEAKNPALEGIRPSREILATNTDDDPDSMIGYRKRFLGRGSSWLWFGQSGLGKSTLAASFALHAAAGIPWHGIQFRRPLRTLMIQAENDDGDLAEMLKGAIRAAGMSAEDEARALGNLFWRRECVNTGAAFCDIVREAVSALAADLVLVDPLLSYIGGDISKQEVASHFFRNLLQPVLMDTGVILVAVHHTGKPPKDNRAHAGWTSHDLSYLGLGSSELVNWARAVAIFGGGGDDGTYRFAITKRGKRAGMIDRFTGEETAAIHMRHSERGLGWVQCEPPEEPAAKGGRSSKLAVEDVVTILGDGMKWRRDVLVAKLQEDHRVSQRTVRERLDSALLLGRVHVAATEARPGGGHPVEFIAAGPAPATGGDQLEDSPNQFPRQLPTDR